MSHDCPACGSKRTRSARTYSSDTLRHKLFFTPRRCRDCRHRYWQWSFGKPVALTLVLGGLIGAIALSNLPERASSAGTESLSPVELLKLRADRGDVEAQLKMGLRHLHGDGVPANSEAAVRWFTRAAKQGDSEAQFQLGLALLEGRGVVQDYQAAYRWIAEPARRGHAKAQVALADMYRFGSGIKADNAKAYLWYNLAAAQGDDNAARVRDNVASRLAPEVLAQMQAEARRLMSLPTDTVSVPADSGAAAPGLNLP